MRKDQIWSRFKRPKVALFLALIPQITAIAISNIRNKQFMTGYGIHYLDIAESIFRGNWDVVVNSFWSPIYPAILGIFLKGLQPSLQGVFPVVSAANFLIFLVSLYFFDRLLLDILHSFGHKDRESSTIRILGLSAYCSGILLFDLASEPTPDLLLGLFFFILSRSFLPNRFENLSYRGFFYIGLVMALGCLSKSVFFLLSVVIFFALTILVFRSRWKLSSKVARLAVTLTVVGALVSPFLFALREKYGRWTIGDSGPLCYLWEVNQGVRPFNHAQSAPPEFGKLLHPTRLVSSDPEIFEFASPIAGSYPSYFDPAYWYEGLRPVYDLKQIAMNFFTNLVGSKGIPSQLAKFKILVALFFLLLSQSDFRSSFRNWLRVPELWFVSACGLGAFMTLNISFRYIFPFLIVIFSLLMGGLKFDGNRMPRTYLHLALLFLILEALFFVWTPPPKNTNAGIGHSATIVAESIRPFVADGDHVGFITTGRLNGFEYWPYLSRTRLIAESNDGWKIFTSAPEVQRETLRKFRRLGIRLVVASVIGQITPSSDWTFIVGDRSQKYYYANLKNLDLGDQP